MDVEHEQYLFIWKWVGFGEMHDARNYITYYYTGISALLPKLRYYHGIISEIPRGGRCMGEFDHENGVPGTETYFRNPALDYSIFWEGSSSKSVNDTLGCTLCHRIDTHLILSSNCIRASSRPVSALIA